ncbi:MAG: AAA family ATPase [Calditerrivibrio sp.]|nr:AAA family ATPase [Calditerrivibrio sp.]
MKKRLPIGESNLANLINEDFLYVDKTQFVYKLLTSSKHYFLSCPRRIGKSLLVSTLEQVFKGNKDLSKGSGYMSRIMIGDFIQL